MLIPGIFGYFSDKGPSQSIKVFKWRNDFCIPWDWNKEDRYIGHNVDQFDWDMHQINISTEVIFSMLVEKVSINIM